MIKTKVLVDTLAFRVKEVDVQAPCYTFALAIRREAYIRTD